MSLSNKIIIFDEGHNIEKSAEEGASFSITTTTLMNCHQDLN